MAFVSDDRRLKKQLCPKSGVYKLGSSRFLSGTLYTQVHCSPFLRRFWDAEPQALCAGQKIQFSEDFNLNFDLYFLKQTESSANDFKNFLSLFKNIFFHSTLLFGCCCCGNSYNFLKQFKTFFDDSLCSCLLPNLHQL